MDSSVNDMTTKKALHKLFGSLSAHALYPVESIQQWLRDCGIEADIDPNRQGLLAFKEQIEQINGDWGRGIYPPHVLYAMLRYYDLAEVIKTDLTGRGFAYDDLVGQLAVVWGLEP